MLSEKIGCHIAQETQAVFVGNAQKSFAAVENVDSGELPN